MLVEGEWTLPAAEKGERGQEAAGLAQGGPQPECQGQQNHLFLPSHLARP